MSSMSTCIATLMEYQPHFDAILDWQASRCMACIWFFRAIMWGKVVLSKCCCKVMLQCMLNPCPAVHSFLF